MPRIWLNITHGFQARMLLRSEIARELLASGAELIVCSPNVNEEYFQEEFDHPQITLVAMPGGQSKLERRLSLIRQYALMNPSLGATLNHKREALRRQRPLRYHASRLLNPIFGHIWPLRRAYMAAERGLFPGRQFDPLLDEHRPDLVVTGTPGFNPFDVHLLRAARRAGVPTATVMLSWDNLTSKGYMNAVPDHLLVWSDLMADEAAAFHDFPRERIHWVGAAQFDHYFQHRQSFDRDAWRRRQEIDPHDLLIVYGTINPAILPHEPKIVAQIARAVQENRFSRPATLWVRLHPQIVRGAYRQSLEPYQRLAGPRVRIEAPPVRSESLSWDLPASDARHLADLLAAADVVATPSSTLIIDAACAGTPGISVHFDGDEPVDAALSARRFRRYTHYRQILDTGEIAIADSSDEFVSQADRIATRRNEEIVGRAIIAQQLGRLDGQAGRRTAARLLELAGAKVEADAIFAESTRYAGADAMNTSEFVRR